MVALFFGLVAQYARADQNRPIAPGRVTEWPRRNRSGREAVTGAVLVGRRHGNWLPPLMRALCARAQSCRLRVVFYLADSLSTPRRPDRFPVAQ